LFRQCDVTIEKGTSWLSAGMAWHKFIYLVVDVLYYLPMLIAFGYFYARSFRRISRFSPIFAVNEVKLTTFSPFIYGNPPVLSRPYAVGTILSTLNA
jgi:hypothetical protein